MAVCDYPDWQVTDQTWSRALKRALFGLQFGSSAMHMAHTDWGRTFDDDFMAVTTYVGYQTLVANLNISDPIVLYLTDEPQMDARDVAERMLFLGLE
jgi:hypothetical protein